MFRLIAGLFRLIHRCFYFVLYLVCSKIGFGVAMLVGVIALYNELWTNTEFVRFFGVVFFSMFTARVLLDTFPPRTRQRRVKPLPIPTVIDLSKPADRPSVGTALARLDPALRRIIETPPPPTGFVF